MIYLDNAATTFPKPETVTKAMADCMFHCAANPGRGSHALSIRAGELLYDARETVATFFGASPEHVIFTGNCTQAINFALKGVLKDGDHVIVSSLEHNAVYRPLFRMQEEGRIRFDVADVVPDSDAETVRNFADQICSKTKLIFTTHVSNVFGTELPLAKLSALAGSNDLLFGVDAAQSAGIYPLNMEDLGIDLLCLPGHKGLFGPMGTGALLFGKNVSPEPIIEGGTGSLSLQPHQPEDYPDRLESGTVNLPGIAGLRAGIRFLNRIGGASAVHEREAQLVGVLKDGLRRIPGVRVFDELQKDNAALLSFAVQGQQSEETALRLNQCGFAVRGGYHCAALAHEAAGTTEFGTVRVSPGYFNKINQIKSFVFCLNQIALTNKIC